MLLELHIENFAIIDELSLSFGDGLCVITGETGAGKSLVVGALQLVLGERGGADKIRSGEKNMKIWARFAVEKFTRKMLKEYELKSDEIVITRQIADTGRSQYWLNGKPATAESIREIGKYLVDIHGQHSHQLLLDASTHLSILDGFAKLRPLVKKVGELFDKYSELSARLDEIRAQKEEMLRQKRLLEFELDELDSASLNDPDEERRLENELLAIESTEQLLQFSAKLSDSLIEGESSVMEQIGFLKNKAKELPQVDEVMQISSLFETVLAGIGEIGMLAEKLSRVEYDAERAEHIRARLRFLGDIQRKYRKNIAELIDYRNDLRKRSIESGDIEVEETRIENELSKLRSELNKLASELSERRQKHADTLSKSVERELDSLAMAGTEFIVQLVRTPDSNSPFEYNGERVRLSRNGFERCEFLLSANPGTPPRELRKIASGGELSRIALAIKVASPSSNSVPCAIFDEIDAGIGGNTAIRIAQRLQKLAQERQVIVITHLHSIARRANYHIYIEKRTAKHKTKIDAFTLSPEQRQNEIKRMMALE